MPIIEDEAQSRGLHPGGNLHVHSSWSNWAAGLSPVCEAALCYDSWCEGVATVGCTLVELNLEINSQIEHEILESRTPIRHTCGLQRWVCFEFTISFSLSEFPGGCYRKMRWQSGT